MVLLLLTHPMPLGGRRHLRQHLLRLVRLQGRRGSEEPLGPQKTRMGWRDMSVLGLGTSAHGVFYFHNELVRRRSAGKGGLGVSNLEWIG
jgi:hypothetical protein